MNPPCTHVHEGLKLACVLPYQHAGHHQFPNDAQCADHQDGKEPVPEAHQKDGQAQNWYDRAARYAETKPVWSQAVFAKLPLPQRMRAAADVLEEVCKRAKLGTMSQWNVDRLRKRAALWEAEDAGPSLSPHEVIVQVTGNTFGSGDEYARDILTALESAGYAVTRVT